MNAVRHGSTSNTPASSVAEANVITRPTVSRLRTTWPTRRRYCTSIENAPSKTSSATRTSRLIAKISCRSAGSKTPSTEGPAMTPARR